PPRWLLEPRDTSAIAGRSARIDCQADGVPQPHVRWKMSTSFTVVVLRKTNPSKMF
ncbi:hypothetical protein CEXT_108281, partial [Caerostris extrusa]